MKKSFIMIALFFVALLAWFAFAPFLAKNLIVERRLESGDAILVLGGSTTYKERTKKAASVYAHGKFKRIIVTDDGGHAGWSQTEQRNPRFVDLAKRELITHGVPEDAIEILSPEGSGTVYEARKLKTLAAKKEWNSVVLVTSGYHTRRAFSTFREVLSNDIKIGVVSPPPGDQTPEPSLWWLQSKGWQFVAGEYVKIVAYWLFY